MDYREDPSIREAPCCFHERGGGEIHIAIIIAAAKHFTFTICIGRGSV
jgi:hypothetical protein